MSFNLFSTFDKTLEETIHVELKGIDENEAQQRDPCQIELFIFPWPNNLSYLGIYLGSKL